MQGPPTVLFNENCPHIKREEIDLRTMCIGIVTEPLALRRPLHTRLEESEKGHSDRSFLVIQLPAAGGAGKEGRKAELLLNAR